MKQLVILCHPLTENLSQVIGSELSSLYKKYKVDVELRDLYQLGFNPILSKEDLDAMASGLVLEDVEKEQKLIQDSNLIIFVYIGYYTGMPAMMHGYIERVFSEGFAFSFTDKGVKKLLEGKKVVLVDVYEYLNNTTAKKDASNAHVVSVKALFESFGMEVILHHPMENVKGDLERNNLQLKLEELKDEIKKSLILTNNFRLSIPNVFL